MENHFIILCCFCHTTMQYIYNCIYIPPTWAASPPPAYPFRSWQSTRQGSLCYLSTSHMMMYICQCYFFNSSHPQLSPLCPPVHSLLGNQYHFSRFHLCELVHYTCLSLSDLLHSVWETVGSSTSLQMPQFHSFLWLSNIPLCIYIKLLYPFICWWTSSVCPHPGYCS